MTIKKHYIPPSASIELVSIESYVLGMSNVSGGGTGHDGDRTESRPRTGYQRTMSDPNFGSIW